MPAVSGGTVPALSQIQDWQVAHLEDAATHWSSRAWAWEESFTDVHQQVSRPGGRPWEGMGADAAYLRTGTDKAAVSAMADSLHGASAIAREGASEISWAKQTALTAIEQARGQGFSVGQDLSVTDKSTGLLPAPVRAARQLQAQGLAAEIRATAQNLVAVDTQVGTRITTALTGLNSLTPGDSASSPGSSQLENPNEPRVQMVDHDTFKEDTGGAEQPPAPSGPPPARGLPPEGVQPPVEGPLTQGPASRPSEVGKGGQSLWDEHGGEWRYFPGDKWHNPHWDYNGHANPNAPWDNVPIGGLPPRIGDPPPIISGLPPWLQNPATPGVVGPPQNPLLAPFPGANAPAPAPLPTGPAPGTGLMPHINMPNIDLPAPNPGDMQAAGQGATVLGGGGLLMLILMALSPG